MKEAPIIFTIPTYRLRDVAETIDRVNIYQATRIAMLAAVQGLPVTPDHLLIDAMRLDHTCAQTKLYYGDALSLSIAAASVVAKVHRDRLMRELDTRAVSN